LDGLGLINKKVRSGGFWAEAPDFLGVIDIPFEFVGKDSVSFLLILSGSNGISFNSVGNIISEWFSDNVNSVMLVG
jgi:hypothetical protein